MADLPKRTGNPFAVILVVLLGVSALIVVAFFLLPGPGQRPPIGDAAAAAEGRLERAVAKIERDSARAAERGVPDEPVAPPQPPAPSRPPKEVFTNSLGMTFAYVPPGSFVMGGKKDFDLNEPDVEYPVRIDKGFWLGVHEVTRAEFGRFVRETGFVTRAERHGKASLFDPETLECDERELDGLSWRSPGFEQADDHPVTLLYAQDAEAFCQWLSREEGRTYRLPGEAEWEYAARAGGTGIYVWGDRPRDGAGWANLWDRTLAENRSGTWGFPWSDGFRCTAPVGSFKPNAWGFRDIQGNVAEWCEPWTGTDPDRGTTDRPLPPDRVPRTARGGSWCHHPETSAVYGCYASSLGQFWLNAVGFRVLLEEGEDLARRQPGARREEPGTGQKASSGGGR